MKNSKSKLHSNFKSSTLEKPDSRKSSLAYISEQHIWEQGQGITHRQQHRPQSSMHSTHQSMQSYSANVMQMLSQHYEHILAVMKIVEERVMRFQLRIAQLYRNFNSVELQICRKSCKIKEHSMIELQLKEAYRQIEQRMRKLRQEYDNLKKASSISQLDKKIANLKASTQPISIPNLIHTPQAISQQPSNKNEKELYMAVIRQLTLIISNGKSDLGRFLQSKIKENLQMKRRIIEIEAG